MMHGTTNIKSCVFVSKCDMFSSVNRTYKFLKPPSLQAFEKVQFESSFAMLLSVAQWSLLEGSVVDWLFDPSK